MLTPEELKKFMHERDEALSIVRAFYLSTGSLRKALEKYKGRGSALSYDDVMQVAKKQKWRQHLKEIRSPRLKAIKISAKAFDKLQNYYEANGKNLKTALELLKKNDGIKMSYATAFSRIRK